jgi:electron transfer flavoprotein alpha/beta subunit
MFARRLVIADGSMEVTREVDGGMQTISQKRPAITTTDLRPDDLCYPSLPNIMNKKKPIYAKTPTDLGVDVAPRPCCTEAFQYEPGRPRGFDHATRTNCARSSSVIRLSDLTAIATSVARREPWRDLNSEVIAFFFCRVVAMSKSAQRNDV